MPDPVITPPTPPTPTPPPTPPTPPSGPAVIDLNHLDADLRTNKTLAALAGKPYPEMARMLANAEGLVGKKGSIIPTDPNDKAGWDSYFRAVGWPEKPESYPAPALPAGLAADEATDKTLRAWCHELRLTGDQFKGLMERIAAANVAERNNAEAEKVQAQAAAKAALQTELGARYDYGVQLANTVAAAFADDALLARMKEKGWLDDPDFLRYSAKIGEAISPDRLHADRRGATDTTGIEQKIRELETSDAYRNHGTNGRPHPQHEAVTQQVLQLRQQLVNAQKGRGG